MASEIRAFTITVPANTPANAPLTFDTSFDPREVEGVEIVLPAGLNGAVGMRILNSNQQSIPANGGGWIVGSGNEIKWPLEDQITSGSWQVQAYNTGRYAHTFYVRYLLKYLDLSGDTAGPALISNAALSNATTPDLSAALSLPAPAPDGSL